MVIHFLILFPLILPCSAVLQHPHAPPPSTSLSPSDFPNLLQYNAYNIIQNFKKTITCDPNGITTTWVGSRPCNYMGFSCDTPPNLNNTPTIATVDFNGFGLCAPTLSGFIDNLPDLALFHANTNSFSGSVPDLSALTFLYELDLSNNRLSGAFPSYLLSMTQLIFLDIRYNSFSGTVPPGIFSLDLDVLFLNNNGFSQTLPANLGATPVAYLTLANNEFTGPIPSTISNSSDTLVEVLFLNNKLTGCLPYEIGSLEKATVFDIGSNQVTGPIPLSFACLKNVQQLNLADNLLYGHVPTLVCKLADYGNLANLSLSGNYFTSFGIGCIELIKNGVLDLSRNCIVGLPNQRSILDCAAFIAKPKHCPIVTYMPCLLHHTEGNNDASPPRASLAYNAVHSPHG